MTMPNLNDVLGRIISISKTALAGANVIADGVAFFDYTQGEFPYLTARISNVLYDDYIEGTPAEDLRTDVYTVTLRLIIAHLTADYDGRNETRLYDMIPGIREGLSQREQLQLAPAYTDIPLGLRHALVVGSRGLLIFNNAGVDGNSVTQVGTEFTIECRFDYQLSQVYS